jgi:DNA-binding MarR family transcriptional regulator
VYDSETPTLLDGRIGAGFDEYLFYLLTQIYNRRNRDFAPALEAIGLTIAEWRAMSVVNRLDGCLMSELAEFTTVDRTTLTRTVDQLVKARLVRRGVCPEDRRQVRVTLTDHGHAVFAEAVEALRGHNSHALQGLSEPDLTTLRSLLQRILMNIVDDEARFQQVVTFGRLRDVG